MTANIDLYWSFRSPYSYLALKRIHEIAESRDVVFYPKIVLPLALRDPSFFDNRGSLWFSYVIRDIFRLAQMTGQIIAPPNPDPIVQNMITHEFASEQPYIWRLSRMGVLAVQEGQGLAFMTEVSQLIWSGQKWDEGTALAEATMRAGLDFMVMDSRLKERAAQLDKELERNGKALESAGHWGVPTCVLDGEPFFGMDRLDVLCWRLDQLGIA